MTAIFTVVEPISIPNEWFMFITSSATQNVLKYTQNTSRIEVLTDTSYCFIVYALAIAGNTLLASSNIGTTMYTPQS